MASHKGHIAATRCGYSQRVAEFPQRVVVSANQNATFSNPQRFVKVLQSIVGSSHNVLWFSQRVAAKRYDPRI